MTTTTGIDWAEILSIHPEGVKNGVHEPRMAKERILREAFPHVFISLSCHIKAIEQYRVCVVLRRGSWMDLGFVAQAITELQPFVPAVGYQGSKFDLTTINKSIVRRDLAKVGNFWTYCNSDQNSNPRLTSQDLWILLHQVYRKQYGHDL